MAVSSIFMGKPFSDTVRKLNQSGMRYYDMQRESNEARSSAWWNQLANGYRDIKPPTEQLDDIAEMMGVTERRVREMIAEEWYDIRPGDVISERVRHLASAIDELTDEDAQLVEQLIHRLRQPATSGVEIIFDEAS